MDMNFDDLKNQWNNESIPSKSIPEIDISLKYSNNAIDKVRKNMRMDFWSLMLLLLISIVTLVLLPHFIMVHHIILFIMWSLFVLFLVLSSYFFYKFYKFYKKSYTLNYTLKDNLWWFYYELRSFVDFYYTFAIVGLTMGLCAGLSLGYIGANLKFVKGEDNLVSDSMDHVNKLFGPFFLAFMVLFLICSMVGLHYAVKYMYGKHLKQLKDTLDLLREV